MCFMFSVDKGWLRQKGKERLYHIMLMNSYYKHELIEIKLNEYKHVLVLLNCYRKNIFVSTYNIEIKYWNFNYVTSAFNL